MATVVSVDMEIPPLTIEAYDKELNGQGIMNSLDLLEEHRESGHLRIAQHQSRVGKYYNSLVKQCRSEVGALVLRKIKVNTKNLKDGTLSPNWEGPYRVTSII